MLTVYKASAGSGKTFTLAYRYIKLLLGRKDEKGRMRLRTHFRDNHRAILAVTFTNKATDEMKRRIVHELAVLGRMEPCWKSRSGYMDMLVADLHCSEHEIEDAARKALRDLLFDFNFFQVSTIDSFFQVILRTFAREAELTGNYEVDLDSNRALEYGVRALFMQLRLEPQAPSSMRIINWITQYLLERFEGGKAFTLFNRRSQVFEEFMKLVATADSEEFKTHYSEMMAYINDASRLDQLRRQLTEAPRLHASEVRSLCSRSLELIGRRGYDEGALKVSANLLKKLQQGAADGCDTAASLSKTLADAAEDITAAFGKKLAARLTAEPDEELTSTLQRACRELLESRQLRKIWKAIAGQMYVLGLMEAIYKYVAQFRAENNTMLLSDTNSLLKRIIGDDDAPFVFERIGVWLSHFLIDEFQDTSKMQWEILRPLVSEGQAEDHDSLIIGDEKQCIYRFRSSDPTLLQTQVFKDFGEKARIEGNTPEGNTNWRSSAQVVQFNNELFSFLASALHCGSVYEGVVQQISKKHRDHKGYVAAFMLPKSTSDEFRANAIEMMVSEMRRQLRSGYRGGDIAVLVRNTSHAVMVIERLMELTANDADFANVRVISDDAMMLASSPAVRHVISVLRYVASLNAEKAMPQVESPYSLAGKSRRMREREIQRLLNRVERFRCAGMSAEKALDKAVTDAEDSWDIAEEVGDMACFNLPSLIERIIARSHPQLLSEENMFLSALQDVVADFCSYGTTDVVSFLDWWDSKGHRSTVSAPADADAVRVMTIHKSKGLEFSCVHVPMLSYDMIDFKGTEWFEKAEVPLIDIDVMPPLLSLKPGPALEGTPFEPQYQQRRREMLLDELNVLYVALTRAVDELVICFAGHLERESVTNIPLGAMLAQFVPRVKGVRVVDAGDMPEGAVAYALGEPTQPRQREEKELTALDPREMFEMPPYHTADRDDLWANTRIDDLPDYSQARDRGVALHNVLSRVGESSQLLHAVMSCVHSGLIPHDEASAIKDYLQQQLARPDVAQWFSGYRRALTERSILIGRDTRIRPDRVVWTADGNVDVIDYKFGAPAAKYSRQVAGYMKALESLGYGPVRGFLWYVDSGCIEQVTPKTL